MVLKNLTKNREFVEKNRDALLQDYENKYILVFEEKVVGSFDTYEKAASEGITTLGIEKDFLVYQLTRNQPVNFVMEAIL
jgi:hypothetical protein